MFQREAKRLKEITHDKSIVAKCCKENQRRIPSSNRSMGIYRNDHIP